MHSVTLREFVHILASDVARKQEYMNVLSIHPGPFDQIASAHTRHVKVANQNVVFIPLHHLDCGRAVIEAIGAIAAILKHTLDQFRDVILVIDDEHGAIRRQPAHVVGWSVVEFASGMGHGQFDGERRSA